MSSSAIPRVSSTSSELNDVVETCDGKKTFVVSKSRTTGLINWFHVVSTYLQFLWLVLSIGFFIALAIAISRHHVILQALYYSLESKEQRVLGIDWRVLVAFSLFLWYAYTRSQVVYLLDFTTFEPPDSWKISSEQIMEILSMQDCFNEESLNFMSRMLTQSGVGPATAWPPAITRCLKGEKYSKAAELAREEGEIVIFDCVRRLLENTKTKAKDIDFLVINCSLFSPTPSLCSMVINEFGMRSDIGSYNLSGMGCSAGLISIELVKNLMAGRPNSLALVVSTENITQNLYQGNERGFLVQNTLFRCGGAATLMSNKWFDGFRAQLKLLRVVRTQYINEDSYGCVYETEDGLENRGVRLSKDIVKVAGRAMEQNFTRLGPYVLSFSEQFKTVVSIIVIKLSKLLTKIGLKVPKMKPYIPNFTRGVDHFCIHAGGRGVIDGIERNLQLSPSHVAASRYVLHTYGNTSSSSIWYEMDYVFNQGALRRGQRILQIAFGSGFKCNTAVWLSLRSGRQSAGQFAAKAKVE